MSICKWVAYVKVVKQLKFHFHISIQEFLVGFLWCIFNYLNKLYILKNDLTLLIYSDDLKLDLKFNIGIKFKFMSYILVFKNLAGNKKLKRNF